MLKINFTEKALMAIPKREPGEPSLEVANLKKLWQRAWINQLDVALGVRLAANNKRKCKVTHRLPGDTLKAFDQESTALWVAFKSGKYKHATTLTLNEFFDQHYSPHSKAHHRDHKGVVSRFKKIRGGIGGIRLSEIKRIDIEHFLNGLMDEK